LEYKKLVVEKKMKKLGQNYHSKDTFEGFSIWMVCWKSSINPEISSFNQIEKPQI
jgi:hypothetical protein